MVMKRYVWEEGFPHEPHPLGLISRVLGGDRKVGIINFDIFVGGSLVGEGSKKTLQGVASLLGLEAVELQRALTSRVMTTTKGGAVGTIIK